MTTTLQAGVAGAGVFGGFHARKYASLPGVQLVGIYDTDAEAARALAAELKVAAFTDFPAFLAAVADVVSIATPAVTHADLARQALAAGRHVYVEKPLAVDVDDAHALVRQAEAAGKVLAVGHQERAVFRAMGLFAVPERPLRIEAVRRGVQGDRNLDVSVVLDLMVHDLDLALALDAADVGQIDAQGRAPVGPHLDECRADLLFENDLTAVFNASRVAGARERTMHICYPSGDVRVDFLGRTFENTTPFALDAGFADTPEGRDPLGASIADFLAAVRNDIPRPLATGRDAVRAIDLALRIETVAASTSTES